MNARESRNRINVVKKTSGAFFADLAPMRLAVLLLLMLLPAKSYTADYRWTGAADSTWTVAGNWDPSGPPGTGDTAIIDTGAANQPVIWGPTSIYSLYIATSGVYGSTLTANYSITASSMVVLGAKGVITHALNSTAELYISTITTGEMWVDGKIDVTGKGYAPGGSCASGYGPGAGTGGSNDGTSATGAGHGGQGGGNRSGTGTGGAYGSYNQPLNIGSGGGSDCDNNLGGYGGGAVRLNVASTLTINGSILANGGAGTTGSDTGYESGGGGSGGSVLINAGAISGAGLIASDGGSRSTHVTSSGGGYGGGGGGGRIAVIGSTASFTGTMRAYGNYGYEYGGAGTVFIKTPGTNGTLIIDNNNIATSRRTYMGGSTTAIDASVIDGIKLKLKGSLTLVDFSTLTLANVSGDGSGNTLGMSGRLVTPSAMEISSYTLVLSAASIVPNAVSVDIKYAGTLELAGTAQAPWPVLNSITIRSNGLLTHSANTTAESNKLSFTLNDMTIDSGGKIDVSSKGYVSGGSCASGNGPGAGTGGSNDGTSATGAGYGGQGGRQVSGTGSGAPYGSYSQPVNIGSGGGSDCDSNLGGAGGGAVRLDVSNTLTVNGSILANGGSGTTGTDTSWESGGGGSGGSVWINAGALNGAGLIASDGGSRSAHATSSGGGPGGGGGGGRIAVIGSTTSFTGTMRAYGYYGYEYGGAGTVFIKTPGTNGTLRIDNNNIITPRYSGVLAGDSTLDSIQAVKKSSGTFLSFSTLTIKGENAFFDGDNTSTVTVSGNVYGGVFQNVYKSSFTVKWGAAGNPANTSYTAEVSRYSDFSLIAQSSTTLNRFAGFEGLEEYTIQYARVKNNGYAILRVLPGGYVVTGSTSAAPGPPPQNPYISQIFLSSISAAYQTVGASGYLVQASSVNFNGTGVIYSSSTPSASLNILAPQDLEGNTTYYFRAGALWGNTTAYAYILPPSTATLAQLVANPLIYSVFTTSATLNWLPRPVSPSSSTAAGYVVDASTASNFTGTLISSYTRLGVEPSTLTVSDLWPGTTYYFRIGSYNWNYLPNYVLAGSTFTGLNITQLTWTGATDTVWATATNWNPNGVPGPDSLVVIDTNAANQPVTWSTVSVYGLYIATSGVYGSTLTANYPITASSMVVVGAKGVITHTAQPNGNNKVYILSITAGSFNLAGMINISGKGYAGANSDAGIYTGYGPGGGLVGGSSKGGGGGGHGGGGGYGGANPGGGGIGYDSYADPSDMGSGGGTGYGAAGSGSGGSGGGALLLNISNTLQLDGYILANGGTGVAGGSHAERPGGGGGGTIHIMAGSLTGGGTVQSNGSNGLSGGSYAEGGGGAGGRVAIYASTVAFTGVISAYGGLKGGTLQSPENGAAGTVFIQPPGMSGNLIVDNNNVVSSARTVALPGDHSSVLNSIRLNRRGVLWAQYPSTVTASLSGDGTTGYIRVDGRLGLPDGYTLAGYGILFSSLTYLADLAGGTLDNLTVGQAGAAGSAIITQESNPYNSSTKVYYASFTVNGLTIAANGMIDISGKGYAGAIGAFGTYTGYGPGGGGSAGSNKGGGGGGHGGSGGYGGANTASGGTGYDSFVNPSDMGSGGGIYAASGGGVGGSGGGALYLNAGSILQLNGSILANGSIGSVGSNGERPGGGGGGTINIIADSLTGGGTVQANGSNGVSGGSNGEGGGGGGGRVAIYGSTASFTGIISAYGGAKGGNVGAPDNGAAGTIFIRPPGMNGNLIVDNDSKPCAISRTVLPSADYSSSFNSVWLRRQGNLWAQYPSTFPAGVLNGDATTGYMRVDGRLDMPGTYVMSGYVLVFSSMTWLPGRPDLTVGQAGAAGAAMITNELNLPGSAGVHYASFTVNSLTIAANGSIDVSGRGYYGGTPLYGTAGNGPGGGAGGSSNKGGGGGGHGGAGGSGGANTGSGGISYGNFAAPSQLGSGGGEYGNGTGGTGGGALIVNAGSSLQLNGQILANGNNGVKGSFGECPGGGAGGSIYIIADALTGGGTVQANGGTTTAASSNADGGGGAGGRVAIYASTASFTGVIRAYGGARGGGAYGSPPAQNSGAGTVYIKPPAMDGNLIIDNNGLVPVDTCTVVIAGNYAFNSLRAVNKSSATFQGFSTVTVTGDNAFLEGDNTSTVTVGGNVYGGSFPEVYLSSFSVKWGAAGNPANANYTAEVSTYSDYSVIEKSSATYNRNAFLIDVLEPNTTYYARVKTPNYATLKLLTTNYVVIGATATWAAQPGTPANPFTGIFGTSVTVTWLANGNPPYTEYQVQASTAADFTGTLFGPYTGPSSWNTGVSTSVISLAPCTTYYFQVKARNMNGIETGFEVLGSTTTASYFDCGLKYFDGTQVISAACVSTGGACTGTSRLKMGKAGTIYNIGLVDPVADPSNASKMRIQTPEGIRAIRKYP